MRAPQGWLAWCAHTHTHTSPPTPPHGLTGLPPLCTRTRVGPRGAATGRRRWGGGGMWGVRFLLKKLCKGRKLAEMRAGVCPETPGRECQTSQGWGEGRRGVLREPRGALTTQPGAGLRAPRSCSGSSSVRVLAAGSPGFPLTCPGGNAADRRAGLGRLGWEQARPPPWAGESLGTRGHPGSAPHRRPQSRA